MFAFLRSSKRIQRASMLHRFLPARRRTAGRPTKRWQTSLEMMEPRLLLAFDPSGLQQEMLEHVNRMRGDPQGELSVLFTSISPLVARDPAAQQAIEYFRDPTSDMIRRDWTALAAVPPLAWNEALVRAATAHSELMIRFDSQEHQLPGEPALRDRTSVAGYDGAYVGENIYAYGTSIFEVHSAMAIDWGVPSRGHRTNLMNPNYRDFGTGILLESDPTTDVGDVIVTQNFGSRRNQPAPFVLGVVYSDYNSNGRYDANEGEAGVRVEVSGPSGMFVTTTMSAGGYQLAVPAGTYTITITGRRVRPAIVRPGVTVGAANVKHDFEVRWHESETATPTIDVNGDGVGDLIWVATSGVAVAHLGGESSDPRVLGGGGGWRLATTGDFDGDGVTDLLWQADATGYVVLWLMRANGSQTSQRGLGGDRNWRLEATGDYNGDGRTDIVWRHRQSGANVMWLMGGLEAFAVSVIAASTEFRLVSVDESFDADGDGRTDMLWRRGSTGATVLWFMNGFRSQRSLVLGGDQTWLVTGGSDYNGDGYGDLLWRHAASGATVCHSMIDGSVIESAVLGGDRNWSAVGAWLFVPSLTLVIWRHAPSGSNVLRVTFDDSSLAIGGNATWRLLGRPQQF